MNSRNRKIRVANADCLSAFPFKVLSSMDIVEYEENSPALNARKLHQGEVDVALIPIEELASHGGYVGLDFGISYRPLTAERAPHTVPHGGRLHTITDCNDSRAVSLLMKVLASEHGEQTITHASGRTSKIMLLRKSSPKKGETPPSADDARLEALTQWFRLTGQPFVFLVWAIRPGSMSRAQHKIFNETFHRCSLASQSIVKQLVDYFRSTMDKEETVDLEECVQTLAETHQYYLDRPLIDSLNDFLQRAARENLLPESRYRSATFTLFDQSSSRTAVSLAVDRILQDAADGKRLNVLDATHLASEASLADLALALQMRREKVPSLMPDRIAIYRVESAPFTHAFWSELEALEKSDTKNIYIPPSLAMKFDDALHLVQEIRARHIFEIEFLDVPAILKFSAERGLAVREILSQLHEAGISTLCGRGGGMLIDRHMNVVDGTTFDVATWLAATSSAHRLGMRSSCHFCPSPDEGWEARCLHLHLLRTLQDQHEGFAYLKVALSDRFPLPLIAETRMRATFIASLFLINLYCLQGDDAAKNSLSEALSLSFTRDPDERGES